jgi:hypothetical protein
MNWQECYAVNEMTYRYLSTADYQGPPPRTVFVIVHNGEREGLAYKVEYRTRALAERGARRLYRRVHGYLEETIGLE